MILLRSLSGVIAGGGPGGGTKLPAAGSGGGGQGGGGGGGAGIFLRGDFTAGERGDVIDGELRGVFSSLSFLLRCRFIANLLEKRRPLHSVEIRDRINAKN